MGKTEKAKSKRNHTIRKTNKSKLRSNMTMKINSPTRHGFTKEMLRDMRRLQKIINREEREKTRQEAIRKAEQLEQEEIQKIKQTYPNLQRYIEETIPINGRPKTLGNWEAIRNMYSRNEDYRVRKMQQNAERARAQLAELEAERRRIAEQLEKAKRELAEVQMATAEEREVQTYARAGNNSKINALLAGLGEL